MLTRRGALAAAAAAAGLRAAPGRRPNFVFLIADDHAAYVLGADGNRQAHTPRLDRLASEGTYFARHYCNSPVCTPSRQSFLTGLLPHASGVTRLPTPLSDQTPTLATRMREAGYTTAVFGKMHFVRPPFAGQHGFDIPETEYAIAKAWDARPFQEPPAGVPTRKMPWRPMRDHARLWLNADRLPYPRRYDDMKSTFTVRAAERFLDEHRNKPFALWVSLQEPHSPFDFPLEDRDRFDPAGFTPPRVGPEDAPQIPLIFRDLTDSEKRGIIASYYTSTAFMDRNMGVVLDKLRALGLEENTLVVYAGDNGYCLGHHGRFEKHCGYEQAVRVPLIMRWPGHIRRGVVGDLAEMVDVPATIFDLLGVEPPSVQHGRSLRPYLEGRRPSSPRDHIFSEYLENEEAYIRTARHKFIYCTGKRVRGDGYKTDNPTPGGYVRLFDLERDPGEFTDVSRAHPDLVRRFQGLLLERFRKTHPDAAAEPQRLGTEDALDWYLRPRDV